MAMTKAEKARMQELEHALRLSRAMRFPDYPVPQPMTREEIDASLAPGGFYLGRQQMVARGWFYHANVGGYGGYSNSVTYGCSNGMSHSREGDYTTSQNMGRMYRTKSEAFMALRHELTTKCAEILADIDCQVGEAAP
jgi:hypothetical protein